MQQQQFNLCMVMVNIDITIRVSIIMKYIVDVEIQHEEVYNAYTGIYIYIPVTFAQR